MKNYEKIVPAVAMSLAVAGLGGINAFAEEAAPAASPADQNTGDNGTQQVAPASTDKLSTTTNSVVPSASSAGDTSSASDTSSAGSDTSSAGGDTSKTKTDDAEDHSKDTVVNEVKPGDGETGGEGGGNLIENGNYDVNVNFDMNGDKTDGFEVNNNGGLSVESTPSTNPDGTTSETSDDVHIGTTDPITAEDGTPFTEDQEKVENATNVDQTKPDGSQKTAEEIKQDIQNAIKDAFEDGDGETSPKITVDFEDVEDTEDGESKFSFSTSMTVDKPLSDTEKETVKNAVMAANGITAGEDGKYYKGDVEVEFNWGEDNSTVTNTTKWTVTIREVQDQTQTGDIIGGEGSIEKPPVEGDVEIDEPSGDITLDEDEFDSIVENANTQHGDKGGTEWTEEWADDNYSYKVEYTESSTTYGSGEGQTDFAHMSVKDIYDNLLDKSVFKWDEVNQKVVTVDGDHDVTFTTSADGLTVTTYSYTVTKTEKPGEPETPVAPPSDQELADAMEAARKNAIVDALTKALGADNKTAIEAALENVTTDHAGAYTVTVDGKSYTVTVTDGGYTYVNPGDNSSSGGSGSGSSDNGTTSGSGDVEISDGETPLAPLPDLPDGSTITGSADATVTVEEEVDLGEAGSGSGTVAGENVTLDQLNGLQNDADFLGGKVTNVDKTENGKIKVTTTKTDDKGVTIETTYTFTYTKQTTTVENNGADYGKEDGWNQQLGAWVYDLNGADAFFFHQGQGAIIWSSGDKTIDELNQMFVNIKGGAGTKLGDAVFVDGKTDTDFWLNEYCTNMPGGSGKVHIEIKDGKVYVYGKDGKQDGLSYLVMGKGTTTTETTTLDGTYDWGAAGSQSVDYNGVGTGDAKHVVEGDGETVTAPSISGSLSGTVYDGDLRYEYTIPGVGYEVSVDGETTAERSIDAEVTVSVVEEDDEEPEEPEEGGEEEDDDNGGGDDVEVPDEEVPLAELPELPDEEVEIPDEDVPLAETPDEEIEIPDEDVPLANVPKTGDISPLLYAGAALSACGLTVLSLFRKKNRG